LVFTRASPAMHALLLLRRAAGADHRHRASGDGIQAKPSQAKPSQAKPSQAKPSQAMAWATPPQRGRAKIRVALRSWSQRRGLRKATKPYSQGPVSRPTSSPRPSDRRFSRTRLLSLAWMAPGDLCRLSSMAKAASREHFAVSTRRIPRERGSWRIPLVRRPRGFCQFCPRGRLRFVRRPCAAERDQTCESRFSLTASLGSFAEFSCVARRVRLPV